MFMTNQLFRQRQTRRKNASTYADSGADSTSSSTDIRLLRRNITVIITKRIALDITMEAIAPRIVNAQVSGTVMQMQATAERHDATNIDLGERIARNPMSITCPGKPNNGATAAQETR